MDERRHQLGQLDPPRRQFVDEFGRLERAQHVQVAARDQHVSEIGQPGDMEQRQRAQVPGARQRLGHLELHEHSRHDQLLMRQRHQLGQPGGPAGVQQDRGLGTAEPLDRPAGQLPGTGGRRHRVDDRQDGNGVGQPLGGLPGRGRAVRIDDDRGRPQQGQQRGQLRRRQPPVDRGRQRARPDQPGHGGDPAGLVAGDDRHHVTGPDARRRDQGGALLRRRG